MPEKVRKAVIMAGGTGTRLRPVTSEQPKPMIRIANVPCMEHIVRLLASHGVERIVVTLRFMPDEIRNYFEEGSKWGVGISYSTEYEPAGTAGSVKLAEDALDLGADEDFFVVSGDALTDVDLTELVAYHEEKSSQATMVLKSVENPLDFGMVITREDGRISRLLEKPTWGQVFSDTVNTGIYLLGPHIIHEMTDPRLSPEASAEYDFSKDLFPLLLSKGVPMYGYVTPGYWEDIGTLEQYASAQRDVLDGRVRGVRPPGLRLRENIYVGERSRLYDEAIEGPVSVGDNVRIDVGARILPYTVLGSNVVVSAGAVVERSTVSDGAYIGEGAEVSDSFVGRSCYVRARARLRERSSLGDDVVIGSGAVIGPDVRIYPHKTIEEGAHVSHSVIHETTGHRLIFRGGRVVGKFNVDITPEFLVRFGASLGTFLTPGSSVTIGRDASPASQVSKRALTSALLSTGVNIRDLRAAHAGVVRHDVLAGKSSTGVHIRAGDDPDDVEILLLSSGAMPMPESGERAIERVFAGEEYRRVYREDIGELIYPGRAVEQYVERLERASDRGATSGATIVVDFAGGVAELAASLVFSRLGINAIVLSGFANVSRARSGSDLALLEDLEERISRVSDIVPTVGAVFGCAVGPTGEDILFVDETGSPVPPDVMLACLLRLMRPERVVLPVNLSLRYREIVVSGGGAVIESRMPPSHVAKMASGLRAELGAGDEGDYVFPAFLPASDCFKTISCLLKFLSGASLSTVRREFGESIGGVVRETVDCPLTAKGRVMRDLAFRFGGTRVEAGAPPTDGVKIPEEDGGWALVIPDPNGPFFYVFAEKSSFDTAAARETALEYASIVIEIVENAASS